MSHFSRIATKVREMDKLKQALEELGHEVEEGPATVRGYRDQEVQADLVIRRPEGYDIGFRRGGGDEDIQARGLEEEEIGDVEMICDTWGLKIDEDEFLEAVMQRYAYNVIKEQATMDGLVLVEEEQQEDGSVRMVFEEAEASA